MAIEETLDRLATNIALLTGAVATLAEAANGTYAGKPIYAQQGAESTPPAAPAAAPTTAKRGRGRPVAGETTPAAQTALAPAPAATEADPFDTAPAAATAPTATLDEVRAALKALSAATTQATALQVLKMAGDADNLTDLQKTPAKYGVVVRAAKAAMPAAAAAPAAEADPFETAAPAAAAVVADPAQKAYSKEDVKAALVKAQKRTGVDTVQAVVMKHGGKALDAAKGVEVASLNALPVSAYGAVVAEVEALPTTKTA